MKIAAARNLMAAAAAAATVNAFCAPVAAAEDSVIHTLGSAAELINGDVVQAWTITNLRPSSDAIPYPVTGTLWEATATDEAIRGSVQPVVSNLNARARSGQTYRVLFGAATPQGVNPAVLAPGQKTTGKVYFDVLGDAPDSVFYSAGGPDLAVWVQPPPAPPRPSSSGTGGHTGSAGAGAVTAAPAGGAETATASPATPAPAAAPAAAGSQGTPLPQGSQGTPIQEGSTGTPIAPATAAPSSPVPDTAAATPVPPTTAAVTPAPAPAAAEQTPAPQGSSGTPVPHGSGQPGATAAPTTTAAAPPPA